MSLPPYLTDDEIAGMTKPLVQGAARIKFLRSKGYKVDERPDGQPLLLRADLERGQVVVAANDGGTPAARDWTDFDNKVRYGRGAEKKRRKPAAA